MAVIPITEEFDHPSGEYRFLDTADVALLDELVARKHTDIRSFYADAISVPLFMPDLVQDMDSLDDLDMGQLEGTQTIRPAEQWTSGTSGPDSARGRKNTLRWTLGSGSNATESTALAVDISNYSPTDELVITFADLPGTALDLSACTMELEDADSNLVTLNFSGATAANGAQAVSWPLSSLAGMTKPTTVRFTFVVTGTPPVTVIIGHIRVLTPTWTDTKLDMDTITKRLVPIFARDGTVPSTVFPKLWRAAEPSGSDDPLPLNSRLAVNFFTGNMTAANRVTLFLRGRREDYLTQLDLDGTDDGLWGENQSSLAARGHQPDYGAAVYNSRDQMDLDVQTQAGLNSQLQVQLERESDRISESWIEVNFHWGVENKVVVSTTEALNTVFTVAGLTSQTQYLLTCDLEDDKLRVLIYPLKAEGAIDLENPVFDSTTLVNEFLLKRRKGRIGWEIALGDGDAWVDSIRSRGLNFGEIITNNFQSFTPVEGARIFVGSSPPIRVPTLVVPYNGSALTVDRYNAQSSDGSFKVQAPPMSGIQTNFNVYEDFENTSISFDLYFPFASNQFLLAALLNERGYMIPLVLPTITGDQWRTMTIRPTQAIKAQSGSYRFVLMQAFGEQTWWIDNLNIIQRSVAWSGRASYNDPWNRENNRWTDFLDLSNSEVDGVMFPERGFWTQIRGKALVQNASIEKIYTKPKYAQLGRMVWNEDS